MEAAVDQFIRGSLPLEPLQTLSVGLHSFSPITLLKDNNKTSQHPEPAQLKAGGKATSTICGLEGGRLWAAVGKVQVALCGRTRATTEEGREPQNAERRVEAPRFVSEHQVQLVTGSPAGDTRPQ